MKKVIFMLAIVAASVAVWNSTGHAGEMSDEEYLELYMNDQVCFVLTTPDLGGPQVVVFDFELVDDSLNHGYTSWSFTPCVPNVCPDGYFLVSGNICSTDDPFAHIPVIDDSGDDSTADLLVAVGKPPVPIRFAEDSPFWAGLSVP